MCIRDRLILSLILLIGCSDSKTLGDRIPDEVESETVETESTPEPAPEPMCPNPIVNGVQSFSGGTLWKPESDPGSLGAGNLVVLIDDRFTGQFDSCTVRRTNGTTSDLTCIDDSPFTQTPFSCFSNGNRQTWRADFRCNRAETVEMVCSDRCQEVVFSANSSCLLYTSPSPRDATLSRMPSSA